MKKNDIFTLIGLIRQCPCIWDKESSDYRNKILRQNAWREICTVVYKGFEDLDQDGQQERTQAITSKWANLRDAFSKSLKTSPGQPSKKKYIYFDQLAFLIKDSQYAEGRHLEDTSSLDTGGDHSRDSTYNMVECKPYSLADCKTIVKLEPPVSPTDPPVIAEFKRKLGSAESVGEVGFSAKYRKLQNKSEECASSSKVYRHADLDDDEAFFISVMPAVKKMCEDTKLDFRMGVMELIKRLRKKDPEQA